MSDALRPRRSVLYMPGANERALEKAKGLPADALILDLEDAVAPDAKAEARDRVCAAVQSGEYGAKELTIRVNGLDTEWHAADLAAAAAAGPDGVVVPKVNSAAEVARRSRRASRPPARRTTRRSGRCSRRPVAMLHAEEIATASARLTVLVMGTNDLAKELHAEHVPGRQPLLIGLQALPARRPRRRQGDPRRRLQRHQGRGRLRGRVRAGPPDRLRRQDAHPPQPARAVQRRVRPERGRDRARRSEIIAAFEEAQAEGRGVVTVNGRMIENLHVDNARRILAMADAIAALG